MAVIIFKKEKADVGSEKAEKEMFIWDWQKTN